MRISDRRFAIEGFDWSRIVPGVVPTAFARACVLGLLLGSAGAPAALLGQSPQADAVPVQEPTLTDQDKLYGLSLIWQEVNYNFAFFDQVPELNWDSTYRAFIPQVLATESTYEYYRVLQRFVALLKDGHTNVFMPQTVWRQHESFSPWIQVQNVQGRMLVRNVGVSIEQQIPIGSEILAIDGVPTTQHLRERVFPYLATSTEHGMWDFGALLLLQGPPDTGVRITYETPRRQRREQMLVREQMLWGDQHRRTDRWRRNEQLQRFGFRWLEEGIAYVELNTFDTDSVAHDFEAVLPQLYRARALVIDLRRNGGGNSGVGYRIASWLTNDTLATSRWRTREHRAAHKAWGRFGEEHRAYADMNAWYDGGSHGQVHPSESGQRLIIPTVVLLGHNTASAAEDFLVAIDAIPHVTTVGQPSNGSTGQPLMFELPGGGRARVVTKRDTYPDERDFVGVGIQPDVLVEPTVADVRAERDVVLEQAAKILKSRLRRR